MNTTDIPNGNQRNRSRSGAITSTTVAGTITPDPKPTSFPPEFRPHDKYTVRWICALSKELTAARAVLDQEHPPLAKPSTDVNTYVLGSIAEHNIVIACLPDGMIGTNQAAKIATRMVNTFQAIKVGLMVGIGGGIPPTVRLGDIVASKPTDQYPGVFQWISEQRKRMAILDEPGICRRLSEKSRPCCGWRKPTGTTRGQPRIR